MKLNKFAVSAMSTLLAVSVCFTGTYAEDLTSKRSSIQSQLNDAKEKLNQTKSQQTDALAELQQLDAQLNTVQAELDSITSDLTETTDRLNTSQEELKQAIVDRDNQYDNLKDRIRVMYENGNTGYLEVLFEADGFGDFLKRVEYVNKLMEYDNELLDNYEKNETIIATNVKTITEDKRSLEDLEAQQQAKKDALDESIAEKNELVKQLNSDVDTYEQQIKDLEEQDSEVQKLIQQAQSAASSSSSSSYSSSSGKVYSAPSGQFMYPVPAYSGYKPNSGYGYRSSPISGRSEFHTGLDLKATLNTDVVAAASGTVIYAGNRGGYGKCVIIDHGNGYSTLYAHNNALLVSVGESVQKGQVISKAGTTGYSTGVHLHFEIRINGQHTNPYPYIYN